jgi:hypothetical protein
MGERVDFVPVCAVFRAVGDTLAVISSTRALHLEVCATWRLAILWMETYGSAKRVGLSPKDKLKTALPFLCLLVISLYIQSSA